MAGVNTLAYYDKATITAVNLYSASTRVEVAYYDTELIKLSSKFYLYPKDKWKSSYACKSIYRLMECTSEKEKEQFFMTNCNFKDFLQS
jgi:hypothetical protein